MLQDRFRKKAKRPSNRGDSSFETMDITEQVPQIDDVLIDVDRAIKNAEQLEKDIRPPQDHCVC